MLLLEVFGWIFLSFLVLSHTIDFFTDPKKRNDRLYQKTAKDVKFNR